MMAATKSKASKKDLVVGLGATGLSIARFLKREDNDAIFYDSRAEPPGIEDLKSIFPDGDVILGDAKLPSSIGRVIASPGVPDNNTIVAAAIRKRIEIVSDIELFAEKATSPFVAITGSNGKSTVTTLLYHMLRANGAEVLAGGNLGEPALDLLSANEPQYFVIELSSFQLHRTRNLPARVAVLLNVSPDHLDWHKDETEYRDAKYRIFNESRFAVVSRDDDAAINAASHCERTITFAADAPEEGHFGIRIVDGTRFLAYGETLLLATDDLAMFGSHNYLNALAALAAGELLGADMAAMLQVLVEFPGLPHRMQFVARVNNVDYVNDSKATNVAAAVASLNSVDGNVILIAGGDGKGAAFDELANASNANLKAAVLIGKDAAVIAKALPRTVDVRFADSIDGAVDVAASLAEPGETVLLAPACASLDQFPNYLARGDAFCDAVEALQR